MRYYRIEYRDHAYRDWFAVGLGQWDVCAHTTLEAEDKAREQYGSMGLDYRATEVQIR